MRIVLLIIFPVLFFIPAEVIFSQDEDYGLTQEQWELIYDALSDSTIIKFAKLDTLQKKIDSLRQVIKNIDELDCDARLYSIIGKTKQDVADFRRKFDETENKVNKKIGTPSDARKFYFDEISQSKAKCLPEFSERYISMKKNLESFVEITQTDNVDYLVIDGDCLWKIATLKYNNPNLWPIIWEANRRGVLNKNSLPKYAQNILNPNQIYPGQALRIPVNPK